ncbi:MAG: hypothetical protein J2P36_17595 [Ktedonobacteraceae bacterium]|nr:hypothetical protein [Ktedonobacteraceae bacterium]
MPNWRALFARIIEDPARKRDIAAKLEVLAPRTLERWAVGETTPSAKSIRKLSRAIPELEEALHAEFPDAFMVDIAPAEEVVGELPLEMYKRTLRAYTTLSANVRSWTIMNLVLFEMAKHLDPDDMGIAILPLRAISVKQVVVGFLVGEGSGTALWSSSQTVGVEPLLGKESRLSNVLASFSPIFLQTLDVFTSVPTWLLHREAVRSMALYPILRGGLLAGGIFIAAVQEGFFNPLRRKLMEEYTALASLGYSDEEFYSRVLLSDRLVELERGLPLHQIQEQLERYQHE